MNERIMSLADAFANSAITEKLTLDEFIDSLRKDPSAFYGSSVSELEKFVELIVLECAQISEGYADGSMPMCISYHIKKHFGVNHE